MSEKTTQETIGKLITDDCRRDAIHIAVAPVTAYEKLYPGQMIGLRQGTNEAASRERREAVNTIGIVDPFLTGPVYPGDKFWAFLFPNTVTEMRHEWQHPAFTGDTTPLKDEAERWLRELAEEYGLDFEEMIEESSRVSGGHLCIQNGSEVRGFEDKTDEFWVNLQIFTGMRFKPSHFEGLSFSCAC